MSANIQIVIAGNKPALYERYIKNNPFYKNYELNFFDTTNQNISATKIYNDFIDNKMLPETWVIFCHQDFFIQEDVSLRLEALDKRCIYGPIGVKSWKGREISLKLIGPKPVIFRRKVFERIWIGQIQAFDRDGVRLRFVGKKISRPCEADALDSCCFIVHSSLIRKHNLKFDTNFLFNLIAPDFSMMAKKLYGIKTKVLQLKCSHLAPSITGTKEADYYRLLAYLIKKYPDERIVTTGSSIEEVNAFKYIVSSKKSTEMIQGLSGLKDL